MKKIISVLMATILMLSISTTALAAEGSPQTSESEVENQINRILAEGAGQEFEIELTEDDMKLLSREEALEVGFTEEDISRGNIYEIQTEYNGSLPSVLYSGDVGYEDVSASSTFTGAGHTMYGSRLLTGISIRSGNANLAVGLYSYNSNWPYADVIYSRYLDGDSWSRWSNIYSGDTYYYKYFVTTTSSNLTGQLPVKFRIAIGVV